MNKYSPFKAAVAELTSTQAQQFYKTRATEDLHNTLCFVITLAAIASLLLDRWVQAQQRRSLPHIAVTRLLLLPAAGVPTKRLKGLGLPVGLLAAPVGTVSAGAALTAGAGGGAKPSEALVARMISVVDDVEASRPRPKTRRVGFTSTNIVFGIDGRTVKELRAIAREQGYRNVSRLSKAELLGLLA
jgi:hypothetical protein